MDDKKDKVIKIIFLFVVIFAIGFIVFLSIKYKNKVGDTSNSALELNLTNLTYGKEEIKKYTQDDFDTFLEDYNNKKLPDIYITEFLFDGVSMYKPYDLDDFVSDGNDVKVEPLKITNVNINTSSVIITGDLTGGMLSINSNSIKSNINIYLKGVKLDTDTKKVPAIYVYNKDITYSEYKVIISPMEDTKNYIEGGKLKKVSLVPSDNLDIYLEKYKDYTNYYGVYTKEQINNILFAKVAADKEDLDDGDPKYFYKAAGAISSDIDLYFEGKGYLEVTSKNKEGIETKGNLTLSGSVGDYTIYAYDDCLNTTTEKSENTNARNTITIDVNSLNAIVSTDADEGDAIDSNGELIINGGTILALAKPGNDSGIDSSNGTYINGGTVLATGDMYDNVNENSEQNFIVLSFKNKIDEGTLVTLLNSESKNIFAYKTDRIYSTLVYSSSSLKDGDYSLYMEGDIEGTENNGFYTEINSYKNGTQLGYSSKENMNNQGMGPQNGNGTPPEKPDGTEPSNNGTPPEKINDNNQNNNVNAYITNKTFSIEGIANIFQGVGPYGEL